MWSTTVFIRGSMKNPRYCEGSFKEQKQKRSGCRCCQWSAGMHQHIIQLALFNSIPEHPNTTMIDSCMDPRVKETTIKRAPTQKKIRYWCLDHYFWEFLRIWNQPHADSLTTHCFEHHKLDPGETWTAVCWRHCHRTATAPVALSISHILRHVTGYTYPYYSWTYLDP